MDTLASTIDLLVAVLLFCFWVWFGVLGVGSGHPHPLPILLLIVHNKLRCRPLGPQTKVYPRPPNKDSDTPLGVGFFWFFECVFNV